MGQIIPWEWRKEKKNKKKLLCYSCKYIGRSAVGYKCKCTINAICFYDIVNNKCLSYKKVDEK